MPEFFNDEKYIYSVDMMFAYIKIFKPVSIKINIKDYLYTLDFKCWENKGKISPKDVIKNKKKYKNDYKRIKKANLKYPIIIAKNNIVDGVHRLTKAFIENRKYIKAYVFDKYLLKKFSLNTINNWNTVDKLNIYDYIQLFYKRFCSM